MGKISNKIQGLVLFKKTYQLKKTDSYTVEKINKEDKIKFSSNLRPQANRYIYTIVLNNDGSSPISQVKIKVISPKFLDYFGYFPLKINMLPIIEENKEKVKNIEIVFGELKEKSSQEIHLQFTPYISPSTGEFKSIITYVNNKGKLKTLRPKPIKIEIEKLILTPKIIPNLQIREFTRLPGIVRVLMSYGIGIRKKINLIEIVEHILQSQNLQLITKDKERGMLWFCGTDMQSSSDILTFSKIDLNRIEIIAYSKNPIILASFLFLFSNILREQLSISKKILKKILKSEIKIFELVCINCGTILPRFPRKGESIICNKCDYEQIVW
ncbi:MAG: hypothetical protein ACFE9C_00975 [Candidatus Hodarchaeota archaeon]